MNEKESSFYFHKRDSIDGSFVYLMLADIILFLSVSEHKSFIQFH